MQIREKIEKLLAGVSELLGINLAYSLKGGLFLTLGNFFVTLANFALAFFFARILPKEIYGTYSYVLAWISVFGIFALPGMDSAVIQSVSRGFENSLILGLKKKIQYGFLGTLASLIIGAYYFYNQNPTLGMAFFIAAAFVPFLTGFQIYNSFLLGKKEFRASATYLVIDQIFSSAVLITTLFLTKNIAYLVSAYLFSNLLPNLFFFFLVKRKVGPPNGRDSEVAAYGKHLSFISVISTVASYLDQFLAFHFLGPAELATYAFATSPSEQIKGFFKSIPDLALPKFSERTEEDLKKTMKRKILILSALTIATVGAYIVLAPWFYKIFFPRYLDAVFLSQIFSLSLLNTPSVLIAGALTAHKKIKKLYLFNIVSPVFQIVIMAVLTPLWGLAGLIWARVTARTFNTFLSLFIYYRS